MDNLRLRDNPEVDEIAEIAGEEKEHRHNIIINNDVTVDNSMNDLDALNTHLKPHQENDNVSECELSTNEKLMLTESDVDQSSHSEIELIHSKKSKNNIHLIDSESEDSNHSNIIKVNEINDCTISGKLNNLLDSDSDYSNQNHTNIQKIDTDPTELIELKKKKKRNLIDSDSDNAQYMKSYENNETPIKNDFHSKHESDSSSESGICNTFKKKKKFTKKLQKIKKHQLEDEKVNNDVLH